MFTIYNNGNVGFRSTADNLYELKNIDEASPARLKPDEGFFQMVDNKNDQDKNDQDKKKSNDNAINEYKKMASIDTAEPVYHVKDIMTKNCIYIDTQSTIKEAYLSLSELDIHQMPVVSFGKRIIGMINKEQVLNYLMDDIEDSKHILNKKIDDIYLKELITADPLSDIRKVAKVMVDFRLNAIPIVDENDILLGIVSRADVIKTICHLPRLQLWK